MTEIIRKYLASQLKQGKIILGCINIQKKIQNTFKNNNAGLIYKLYLNKYELKLYVFMFEVCLFFVIGFSAKSDLGISCSCTVVNRALPPLHGESLKIRLKVPLNELFTYLKIILPSHFLELDNHLYISISLIILIILILI